MTLVLNFPIIDFDETVYPYLWDKFLECFIKLRTEGITRHQLNTELTQVNVDGDKLKAGLLFQRAKIFLALQENDALGLCITYPMFSTYHSGYSLSIQDMWVDPEHRRQGIGGGLLAEVETFAKSVGTGKFWRIELDTTTNNQAAISLYEKHGYKNSGPKYKLEYVQP